VEKTQLTSSTVLGMQRAWRWLGFARSLRGFNSRKRGVHLLLKQTRQGQGERRLLHPSFSSSAFPFEHPPVELEEER